MRQTKKQQVAAATVAKAIECGDNIKRTLDDPYGQSNQHRAAGAKLVLAAISRLLHGDTYAALIDAAGYQLQAMPWGGQRLIEKE